MVRFKVCEYTEFMQEADRNSSVQNRWLLVEFIPCSEVDASKRPTNGMNAKQIWAAIKQSVLHNFGDTGWGAVGLSLTGE